MNSFVALMKTGAVALLSYPPFDKHQLMSSNTVLHGNHKEMTDATSKNDEHER